jgi:hypothetical protein
MITILIYDQCGEAPITFFVCDGDYRHLNGIYVNGTEDEEKMDELLSLVDTDNALMVFPEDAMGPDTHVIVAGFLP